MLSWLNNKKRPEQPDIERRLQIVLLQQQRRKSAIEAIPASQFSEFILQPADLDIQFEPLLHTPGEDTLLAAALECILQGAKIEKDVFVRLYRGGYVQKDTGGKWSITEPGKQLIERKKLYTAGECRIGGVLCAKDWQMH